MNLHDNIWQRFVRWYRQKDRPASIPWSAYSEAYEAGFRAGRRSVLRTEAPDA